MKRLVPLGGAFLFFGYQPNNVPQATITSITAPTASLPTVPQMRPVNAPRPAANRASCGRPFQASPRYAPKNAPAAPPKRAITNEPRTGIGNPTAIPITLPT